MKNKKILYTIIAIIILIIVIVIIVIKSNKPVPIKNKSLDDSVVVKTIQEELKQKVPNKKYFKLKGGEFLTEDTSFSKYSFINNNSIYIYLILLN